MTLTPVLRVFATLMFAALVQGAAGIAAPAGAAAPAVAAVAPDDGVLRLSRAAMEHARGNVRGVIAQLEPLDFSSRPGFAGADRAAFLLGQAYLQLGDVRRFGVLAEAVKGWSEPTSFTRWLAWQQRFEALANGADAAALSVPTATDTLTTLGRDLVGAEQIRLAAHALAANDVRAAEAQLDRVPAASRWSSRATHMRALIALEQGERARGAALLESVLAGDSTYDGRREARLALAAAALEQGRWDEARRQYDLADHDWTAQRDALLRRKDTRDFASLWGAWLARPDSVNVVVLDRAPARAAAAREARAAADLRQPGVTEPPVLYALAHAAPAPAGVLPPAAERWNAVQASGAALATAREGLERARAAAQRESLALADRRRYLSFGLDSLHRTDARLVPGQAMLDSVRASLDALDARLRAVRDTEGLRVARRTAALLAACERQAAWAQGMQRLYVSGPDSARWTTSPDGLPSAAAALAGEQALNAAVAALTRAIAEAAPGWLARSYEHAWGPGLMDRAVQQAAEARRDRLWALVLDRSIDSSRTAAATSTEQSRLTAQLRTLARAADSLAVADAALREQVAREAVERTLAAIEREREGIDYGLAVSRYALAVRLDAADTVLAGAGVARDASPLAASAAADDDGEAPETVAARAEALPALQAFLQHHPGSAARGEVRFRLADLELVQARQEFRQRMAEFLRRQDEGRAAGVAVPVLEPARALAIYRSMLSEDSSFAHLDAVRFNAGMILADAGEPEARKFFAELVATAPHSAYSQEAWLRMGDMAFDGKRFDEAVTLYAHATGHGDPTLAVIANYKLGWSHFNQDHFEPAADAFRAVLDLYAGRRDAIHVDIEGEADAYLVHALAGAGGAPAFARYFDSIGARPYERRVLMSLGQQFRRYGEFPEAAAVDQLVLDRYADAPEALVAAQRMIETYQRADHQDQVRQAQASLAPRFAPGGEWYRRQAGDSLRDAGEAFARTAWTSLARAHHERARTSGSRADWKQALSAYETLLAHWPRDARADSLRLDAGKASTQLGDPAGALRYFGAVASHAPDSLASTALVQRVAATDAWYESTRAGRATGSDSLAHAVIAEGDALLARFPEHALAADVAWRQAQLGVAHGWDERALADLGRMTSRHPADPRAPVAALQRGEALFRLARFDDAGEAFESALAVAKLQKRDSLARRAEQAMPVCAYRGAEAAVAADSNAHAAHAVRFERLAARWPAYEFAPLAQYRAGLAWQDAGRPREAVRALRVLLERHPRCEYVRDARLQVARSLEGASSPVEAAQAYLDFSRAETDRESAAAAHLKAADLLAAGGMSGGADSLRLEYVRRNPADVEGGMSIMEALARRDLATVTPAHPVSALLDAPVRSKRAAAPPRSHLADYLRRAAAHPKLASRDLVAHVRFMQGEEAREACAATPLTQPLGKSVAARKALLDTLLARYRRCTDLGVAEWAHASAFRIGESLQDFAEALEQSEAPPDLAGDDLLAYRSVLADKARPFAVRGQDVWSDLLRKLPAGAAEDSWVARSRAALHEKLAGRFLFHPEVEFPLIEAQGPARSRTGATQVGAPEDTSRSDAGGSRTLARREGVQR